MKASKEDPVTGSSTCFRYASPKFEYENDASEEMIWVRAQPTLRKYYFFKDGELWKVFYAYSTDTWPARFFEDIRVDDPAFARPPQGDTPPAPAIASQ